MGVHSEKLLMLERMADELIRQRECAFSFAYAKPRICVDLVSRINRIYGRVSKLGRWAS